MSEKIKFFIDNGRINMTAGVELSCLNKEEQDIIASILKQKKKI